MAALSSGVAALLWQVLTVSAHDDHGDGYHGVRDRACVERASDVVCVRPKGSARVVAAFASVNVRRLVERTWREVWWAERPSLLVSRCRGNEPALVSTADSGLVGVYGKS